jgi:MFS family permease
LFAGLAGAFLAGPLHHSSPALAGLTIFLTFGTGVVVQTVTTNWPAHRLVAAGIAPIIGGLGVLVASAWTSPPSLTLFLIAGVVIGAAGGAIFRGSLTVVISRSGPDDRAGALATFFTAGYAGVSLPVVGAGLALQHLSPRVTLLIFALAVALGILAAAPILVRPPAAPVEPPRPDSDLMTTMCRGFGARVDDAASEPSHPAAGREASTELRFELAPDQKTETRKAAHDPTGATQTRQTGLVVPQTTHREAL